MVGKKLSVAVTGTKTGYAAATVVSGETAAVAPGALPALTPGTPSVSGTAKVGETLTAAPGTWGPSPVDLAYQWRADGAAIGGATSSSLAVTAGMVGKKLSVAVTGTKTGYAAADGGLG